MTTSRELELFHYGVKGMKWGQRKAEKRDSLNRVASGTASGSEKRKAFMDSSGLEMIRAGGSLKKVAARRANKIQKQIDKDEARGQSVIAKNDRVIARLDRVANGKASRKEALVTVGESTALELMLNKGSLKATASKRAEGYKAQNERIRQGKFTIADRLDRALNATYTDIVLRDR